jgi:hypothetical protein
MQAAIEAACDLAAEHECTCTLLPLPPLAHADTLVTCPCQASNNRSGLALVRWATAVRTSKSGSAAHAAQELKQV